MHPGNALLQWLNEIHPGHARCLAHLYLICTARDLGPFFLEGQAVMDEFAGELMHEDMPARVAARLVSTGAVLSFIFHCTQVGDHLALGEVASRYATSTGQYGPLWRQTADSWNEFLEQRYSHQHISEWLRETLATQG